MVFNNCQNAFAFSSTAKVTIKVVDEKGLAVEGARIGIGFNYNTGNGTRDRNVVGISNDEGDFSDSAECNGNIGFNVTKDGYYKTLGAYDYKHLGPFGWEPRNPELTVVLRKILNPVPMYVRNSKFSNIEIPAADKDVGFDLEKFDWVAPYGDGIYSDFIFHLKRRFVSWEDQDCTLTITFFNKFDGIKLIEEDLQYGSVFKLPRYAPESGYQQKLEFYIKAKNGKFESNVKRTDNYVFRLRSEEEDGKVLKAMYGKVRGSLDFSAINSKTAKIFFKYYLNPDHTRNLEFDPTRNLFGNLPMREQVREP
jgi:hypothetical protein